GGRILVLERDSARRSVWYRQLGLPDAPEHLTEDERVQVVAVGLGSLLVVRSSSPLASTTKTLALPAAWQAWLDGNRATPVLWPVLLDRQLMQRGAMQAGDEARLAYTLGICMALYVGTVAVLLGAVRPTLAHPWRGYMAVGGLSLVFALLTCVIGYVVYPGAVVSRELTLVHVFPQQPEAYITTSATLLSPAPQHYDIEAVSSAAYLETLEMAEAAGRLTHVFDAQHTPTSTQLYMPLWARRHFVVEQFTTSPGFFVEPETTTNEVINRSSFHLQHCHGLTH